ncbi:head GIN domain-containing protein, partial [Bacteroidota bacterium]
MKKQILFRIGIIMSVIVLFTSCVHNDIKIRGYGPIIEEIRDLEGFTEIESDIDADIDILYGQDYSIEIEAQENILDILETDVRSGRLDIEFSKNVKEHDGVYIRIYMPELDAIMLNGVGDIEVFDTFNCDNLYLEVRGAGDIICDDIFAENIYIQLSGVGDIELYGSKIVEKIDIDLSGVGDVNTYGIEAEEVDVFHSGVGKCKVRFISSLDVTITGVGDVYFIGDANNVNSSITGLGKVINDN